jgi:hypothetical protein
MNRMGILLEARASKVAKLTVRKIAVDRNEPDEIEPIPIQDYVLVKGIETR